VDTTKDVIVIEANVDRKIDSIST